MFQELPSPLSSVLSVKQEICPSTDSWGDPNPQVDKYCGIFETFGDRRAAQDVLSGLHKLAEMMVRTKEYLHVTAS